MRLEQTALTRPFDPWSQLFVVALATYPYVFVLNLFLSIQVPGGKNLYVALETMTMVLVVVANWRRVGPHVGVVLATVFFGVSFIVLLRVLAFNDPLLTLAFTSRLPNTFLLYACVCWAVMQDPAVRGVVQRVVVANSLIQAVLGIVHDTWFSHFLTGGNVALMNGGEALWMIAPRGSRFRETGGLISASLYANFIILGMFVIVFAPRRSPRTLDRRWLLDGIALIVMMYGLSLSGSRFPIVAAMVLVAIHLLRHVSIRAAVPMIAALAATGLLMLPFVMNVLNRFRVEGSGGRVTKAEIGWQLLTETPARLLLGAPLQAQDTATSGGLGLSDNSFYAVLLLFGVPMTSLIGIGVFSILALTTRVKKHLPILLYLVGVLLLTNGIYWDIWILYCFATLYSMQPLQPLRPLNHSQ